MAKLMTQQTCQSSQPARSLFTLMLANLWITQGNAAKLLLIAGYTVVKVAFDQQTYLPEQLESSGLLGCGSPSK